MINHIVLCSNNSIISLITLAADENAFAFGPFVSKETAQEWVDNECHYKYYQIIPVDTTNTSQYE